MSSTTFQGPLVSGPVFNSDGVSNKNTGFSVLSQTVTVQAVATTQVATAFVPQFSQILGVNVLTLTAWGNATAALTVGTPTNGSAYLASTTIGTTTGAILPATGTAAFNTSTTQPVVFTVTQGAVNTTGNAAFTLLYVQTERTS